MISPDEVSLDLHSLCAERVFAKDTKDPSERRRRFLMDMAVGRIVLACKPSGEERLQMNARGTWRGLTHRELRENLQADVEAFREAELHHKAVAPVYLERKKRRPDGSHLYRDVPQITFTDEQLVRGLELLVERGYLRKEGEGDDATYFVDKHFFKDLKLSPLPPVINEP